MCGRWLGTRLDSISVVTILCVALFAVALRDSVNPTVVGLALVYAIQMTGLLQFVVRQSIEVEANMVAVERLNQFRDVPSERNINGSDGGRAGAGRNTTLAVAPAAGPVVHVPADWPHRGELELNNIQMRYRPGLPLVLKGLTAKISAGSKVGICGRTGAGKSSVMLVLLRITELAGGTLLIDGLDVAHVPLSTLRSRISIIPQGVQSQSQSKSQAYMPCL